MAYSPVRLACESIDFQNTDFFDELSKTIGEIRKRSTKNDTRSDTVFGRGDEQLIIKCIKKHTGITIEKIATGGPAVYIPQLTSNHIFNNQPNEELWSDYWYDYNDSESVTKLMNAAGVDRIEGSVDMVKGRVGGCFEKMEVIMLLPGDMLARRQSANFLFSYNEMAAIILHETGHVFTTMEYVSRTSTSNQAMAVMARGLDGSVKAEKRKVVFQRIGELRNFNQKEIDEMTACKSESDLSVIFLNATIRDCQQQIHGSVYDVNSCEYLADQYASRYGAGRALVTGLDKIYRYYNTVVRLNFTVFMVITSFKVLQWFLIGNAVALAFFFGFMLIKVTFAPDKEGEIYDNPAARLRRIKLQSVERLKDKTIGKDEREMHLQAVETADKVLLGYDSSFLKDGLKMGELMAYMLRPAFRNAHKAEMLQKELEKFAGNDLFVQSAKLKMV
jgi:hypothetical protein